MSNKDPTTPEYLIRVTIRGDSMAPQFQDGNLVDFRELPAGELPNVGDNVLVNHRDGGATFKRVARVGRGRIVLANSRGVVGCAVPLADVTRIAVAVGVLRPASWALPAERGLA